MPHLSANRGDIYVTSTKHAHATSAHMTHRLEEFKQWCKEDRAQSSSCRADEAQASYQTHASHASPAEREFFYRKRDVTERLVLGFPLFI